MYVISNIFCFDSIYIDPTYDFSVNFGIDIVCICFILLFFVFTIKCCNLLYFVSHKNKCNSLPISNVDDEQYL